ncbi:hypothetical protein PENTCL1PPCAC_9118 [Pristionchus entomophagus]|uniref:UDP-glucuronosyltransferase n=1 Tax=Pristionchus entomophagus TaxID=358040 RepID=A0AAV5SUZ1_9BILA|nr:hypothetical protein PENTCL1PPCAC_9118 [Pristionchus entomophagus]
MIQLQMRVHLLSLVFIFCADAHKILVYNLKFAHSHGNFLGNVADLLVEAGHDVTSLIPEIAVQLKDGTTKSKIVRVPADPEAAKAHRIFDTGEMDFFSVNELNPFMLYAMSNHVGTMFAKQCEATLDSGVVEILQKQKFDVYIVESFDICGMMLAHLIKPRAIIKTSTTVLLGEQFDEVGVPLALSSSPSTLSRSLDIHSITSRAWNIFSEQMTRLMFAGPRRDVGRVFRERFGEEYPTLKEISSNVAYVFTNSEPLIDFATPTLSRVVDIGGLGAKEPKELDEYWISVMNRRPKVVLMSFGSLAKSYLLAPSAKEAILKVVSAFPSVTFIWKYEKKDEFALGDAAKIDNLVLTDWMPQNDLLNHPNLAVFITHGGMGSVQELALRGKPAILIPMFGDQPRNAAMIEHNRLGKVLSKTDINNHEKITALLKELMKNQEFADNSRRIARMLAKKPFSSKDKLLKYVNFAAEFGPSPALRPQSHDMSFIEYHNLDIIFIGIFASVVFTFLSLKAAWFVLSRIHIRKIKNE